MGLDDNYKKAIIKLANMELPKLRKDLDQLPDFERFLQVMSAHTQAMKDLANAVRNMPRSMKIRH